jgi:hypothetical protein
MDLPPLHAFIRTAHELKLLENTMQYFWKQRNHAGNYLSIPEYIIPGPLLLSLAGQQILLILIVLFPETTL